MTGKKVFLPINQTYPNMPFVQIDSNRLTQEELVEYVRMLISLGKEDENISVTDPIALKYIKTLESDINELENTNVARRQPH